MRHLCILLVDDDKIERLKFKKVCQEVNFKNNIIEAKDGETALLLLNDYKTPFDLIISDLNMPGMDGFELLSTLKKSSKLKNIPIVILSTSQRKIDLDRCYKRIKSKSCGIYELGIYI
jgi:CheY-like chemotaxis protein